MRKFVLFLITIAAAARPLHLMPWPKKVDVAPQGSLKIDAGFRIAFAAQSPPRLERAGRRFAAQLARETGIPLQTAPTAEAQHAALLVDCRGCVDHPDRAGDDESYTLDVTPEQARLTAKSVVGAMRGLQTFMQLVEPGPDSFAAPAVHIEDAPRFPWRGLLIDVTSHFIPVAVIERNLDAMEAVKLNVFHWHLTDDQGYRVESRVFPKLHLLGSDGQYYSYDEIRHVIAYARERGIRVIPEIDMPGHCASWLVGYPELGSAPGPYSVIHTFGVYDPVLDPTNEAVYRFLDKLIGEVAALFPDEYLHIGGDEVNGKHWKANTSIQAFIQKRNLKDEAGLQAWFNQRVEKIVKQRGKKMMGWDEVLHPDLPRDVIVQSWRDQESLGTAAKRGHRAILSFGYYLDHLDSAKTYYSVDPAKGLSAEESTRILGGEACMWTEFVSPETIDSRIWPKTAAIAERLWSAAWLNDAAGMYERLDAVSHRLDWRGVEHNRNYADMLRRLAAGGDVRAVRVLADVVEPLGIDGRETAQKYSQQTPLNRLVDTARAESVVARRLEKQVTKTLEAPSGASTDEIRRALGEWRDCAAGLAPALAGNHLLAEAAPLVQALSRVGAIGLEALGYLEKRQAAPADFVRDALTELERAEKPQIEVVLAAVRPVRLLVRACGR